MWQKHGGGLHDLCHQPLIRPSCWQLWALAATTGEHCDLKFLVLSLIHPVEYRKLYLFCASYHKFLLLLLLLHCFQFSKNKKVSCGVICHMFCQHSHLAGDLTVIFISVELLLSQVIWSLETQLCIPFNLIIIRNYWFYLFSFIFNTHHGNFSLKNVLSSGTGRVIMFSDIWLTHT